MHREAEADISCLLTPIRGGFVPPMSPTATITLTIDFAFAKSMVSTLLVGAPQQLIHDLLDLSSDEVKSRIASQQGKDPFEPLAQQVFASLTPLWQNKSRAVPLEAG